MNHDPEKFQVAYQAGKEALERGEYRLSVENLQKAHQMVTPNSRLGGEVGIWLIAAYQAAGQIDAAIALGQKLLTHPHGEIRQQSQNLLYIIQAPHLKRPQEWMSEIPDLGNLAESEPEYRRGSNPPKQPKPYATEAVDLSQVNTKDNQFIWFALLAILLTFLGVIYWGNIMSG